MLLTDARSSVPRPFHLMAKPTGAVCNLDCEYCFYLAKEALYPGSDFRMADDLLERYVSGLLQAHAGLPEVVVAFQGGEPTMMGLDFFRRVLELEREHAEPGQAVLNTLQTNATLLDDAWGEFLAANGFLVGVSIDGPRDLHDAFRVDKGGKPTFDRVMAGLDVLKRHGVEWNALTVVNSQSAGRGLEVYRFLRDDLGAQFIQLIPIVERDGEGVSSRTVDAEAYGQFLIDVFEEWVRHDVGDVFVQSFDTALAHWMGMPELGICVHQETCGRALALEHNGDVYSCDHFVEPAAPGRQPRRRPDAAADRGLTRAGGVRRRQARHPAAVLPVLRRALRLPRRVPQGPPHHDARRRAGAELALRRVPGLLPPRRRADARHGRPPRGGQGRRRRHGLVREAPSRDSPGSSTHRVEEHHE